MTHIKVKNNMLPGFFNLMDKYLSEDFQSKPDMNRPAVNILEKENEYCLEVVAPGINKDDIHIAIEKDLLTISYEKKEEKEEKVGNIIRTEFAMNSFKRSFTLNEKLNSDAISAKYDNGILEVTLPKAEVKQVEVKTVKIS